MSVCFRRVRQDKRRGLRDEWFRKRRGKRRKERIMERA
jgi:hypothetical protein